MRNMNVHVRHIDFRTASLRTNLGSSSRRTAERIDNLGSVALVKAGSYTFTASLIEPEGTWTTDPRTDGRPQQIQQQQPSPM
jgi:hypothetical protein